MFGYGDDDEGHDGRVEEQARRLDALGYTDIHADHTSEYPDPEQRNGRIPDVTADNSFGPDPVVEIDTGSGTSHREQQQLDDISNGLGPEEELFQVDEDDPLFGGF
jgi:hypothetical protein